MAREICFIDTEIGVQDKKIYDIGAVRNNGINFHSASIKEFLTYCEGSEFFCGHNIIHHDMKYLKEITGLNNFPIFSKDNSRTRIDEFNSLITS